MGRIWDILQLVEDSTLTRVARGSSPLVPAILKGEIMYQYSCSKCGYKREGLLEHPDYSWNCPKGCEGFPKTEKIEDTGLIAQIG